MKMYGKFLVILAVVLLLMPLASRADDGRKLEFARQLAVILKTEDMLKSLLDIQVTTFANNALKSMKTKGNCVQDVRQALQVAALTHLDLQALIDRQVAIYAELFSEEELRTIVVFYQSPAGKKWYDTASTIMQKTKDFNRQVIREAIPAIEKEANNAMELYIDKQGQCK